MGNGDGTFRAPVSYAAGVRPNAVVAADVDGDGKLDLIVAANGDARTRQAETIAVLLGNGDGRFEPAHYLQVGDEAPTAGTLASVAAADINGDGKLDLAVTGSTPIEILVGAGDGPLPRVAPPSTSQPR